MLICIKCDKSCGVNASWCEICKTLEIPKKYKFVSIGDAPNGWFSTYEEAVNYIKENYKSFRLPYWYYFVEEHNI